MHHRKDKDVVLFDYVEDSMRKNMGKTATNVLFNYPPASWGLQNPSNSLLDAIDKATIQTYFTCGVEFSRLF